MKLYRLVSSAEADDFEQQNNTFRLKDGGMEVKQFWFSEPAWREYLTDAQEQQFEPPYTHLIEVEVLENIPHYREKVMPLDKHKALTLEDDELIVFNGVVHCSILDLQ